MYGFVQCNEKTCKLLRLLLPGLLFAGTINPCRALEPEPRKWNHLPTGTNFAGVGYARTSADIAFDPTLQLEDVKMDMDTWVGQYIRTFDLFDKSARIDLTQAHLNAEWKGLLNGAPASTARNGWSDSFVRLAVNLYGAPPLSGKQYAAYRAKMNVETIVGVGLAVRLPTGQYMDDKLINLGDNRFAFRPRWASCIPATTGRWKAPLKSRFSRTTMISSMAGNWNRSRCIFSMAI